MYQPPDARFPPTSCIGDHGLLFHLYSVLYTYRCYTSESAVRRTLDDVQLMHTSSSYTVANRLYGAPNAAESVADGSS